MTVDAITGLEARQAAPGEPATWIRQHRRTEALHSVRDVTTASGGLPRR